MRNLLVLAAALLLSACSSFGPGSPTGGPALDPATNDVASLLVAFDLPRGLGPAPSGQLLTFDVANGGPSEHLRLLLEPGDADQASGLLTPPGEGRAYYLFTVKEADKPALRAAQAAAASRGVTGTGIKLGIVPHLCTSGAVDANALTVSVYALVPGQTRMVPFLDHELLAQLLTQPGSTQMPACT